MKPLARPLLSLLVLVFAFGACSSLTGTPDVERTLMYVEAFKVDCVGVSAQKCMLVREDPSENWDLFYDGIEGFTYEPGFRYTLEVEIRQVRNPPADGSSLAYRMVRLIDKVAVQ